MKIIHVTAFVISFQSAMKRAKKVVENSWLQPVVRGSSLMRKQDMGNRLHVPILYMSITNVTLIFTYMHIILALSVHDWSWSFALTFTDPFSSNSKAHAHNNWRLHTKLKGCRRRIPHATIDAKGGNTIKTRPLYKGGHCVKLWLCILHSDQADLSCLK